MVVNSRCSQGISSRGSVGLNSLVRQCCQHRTRAKGIAFTPSPRANAMVASEPQTREDESHGPAVHLWTPSLEMNSTTYSEQLQAKLQHVKALFSQYTVPEVQVFESEVQHYRLRSEFTLRHEGTDAFYVMFDSAAPKPEGKRRPPLLRVENYPVASLLINELMPLLRQEVLQQPILKERLFQVNFHTTLSGEAMISLLYHKKLDDVWVEAAKNLRQKLGKASELKSGAPEIVGRSRKQVIELDSNSVIEVLEVNGKRYVYKQVEGAFCQPNGKVCQHMLSWAQSVTKGSTGDLLELYCGNGNFTIPLAENFRRVVATEVSKASVDAARYNIEANKAENIFIARLSSEEFTETWRTKGTRRRLEGLDWNTLNFTTIFVDPPRAGLDNATVQLLAEFDNIVYVSCNPETLASNLQTISSTHQISSFAVFDQFPFTPHIECGVYLNRKTVGK